MKDLKISARQTGMICVMLIFANAFLTLPSLLHSEVGADGFFVVAGLMFFDLLVLGTFFLLKARFPDDKFYDILKDHLGKILAKIILALFMIFFLFKSLLAYSVVLLFLKQQVYQDQFELIAIISIFPVICHGVFCGIRTISRTIELFFYIVVAGLVVCIGISFTNGGGMPQLFQTQIQSFLSSSFKHAFSFGDYLLLFIIMDKIEIKKGQGRKILSFALVGITLMLLLLIRFYSIYQVTAFMHTNAIVDISSVPAQFTGIGRLDIIAMITVMMMTYFQLELFIYGFCSSFLDIFPKLNNIHAVVLYIITFFVLYYGLLSQYDFFIDSTENYFPYFMIVVNFLVPLTVAIIALTKKKGKEYEKIF